MKCKYENDGDCCNFGSPRYMCKCKPKICHSVAPVTNADRIRAMSDEELAEYLSAVYFYGMLDDFNPRSPCGERQQRYMWKLPPLII